jgi:hypothetical protein
MRCHQSFVYFSLRMLTKFLSRFLFLQDGSDSETEAETDSDDYDNYDEANKYKTINDDAIVEVGHLVTWFNWS